MTIKRVTAATCELPSAVIQAVGSTVVPLCVTIGAEYHLDGVESGRHALYTRLPDAPSHPAKGTLGNEVFRQAYQGLV